MNLLEACFDEAVWSDAIDKGIPKTIDNRILRRFCTPDAKLKLLDQILAGEYHISPPRVVRVPKDNGKIREIYVNTCRDRLILAVINSAYYKLFNPVLAGSAKAYREGCSCAKTVREIANIPKIGYKPDLSKYFDSVPIDVINDALNELDTGSPMDSVVRAYYNDNRVVRDGQIAVQYKSLAQGCAIEYVASK